MSQLETFENAYPNRPYCIKIDCPEFTSICPKTGNPDFGTIRIEYIPEKSCLELKALKYYLHSYRNEGVFYEMLVNRILDDLVQACEPVWMQVEGDFRSRGGITSVITAEYHKPK